MQGINVTLDELLNLRHMANQLQIRQQHVTRTSAQGNYYSAFRGRGMDFVETRVYQPGDDIRAINWPVTARTGRAHTKIYQQERERPIYLIIDFSPSMFFGTRVAFKSVIAARAAGLIAWTALKNRDRIGALLLKDTIALFPPSHNKSNLMNLLKNIEKFANPAAENVVRLEEAFKSLRKIMKSGSLVYFLSDFYGLTDDLKNELLHISRRNEVINIFIYDLLEQHSPPQGQYLFQGTKEEGVLINTKDKNIISEYDSIFSKRLHELKKLSYAGGMHLEELPTNADLFTVMRHLLSWKLN